LSHIAPAHAAVTRRQTEKERFKVLRVLLVLGLS
jgi:hypothetical protein